MSQISFLIKDLGIKNVRPQIFFPPEDLEQRNIDYGSEGQVPGNISDSISMLGTPVFSNLEIPGGSYETKNGEIDSYEGLERSRRTQLDVVLFNVSQGKNIVKTPIQGRNGTVKEYISDSDYQVNIKGGIYDLYQYPQNQVQRLIEICKVPAAIEVNSWYLRMFNITHLVIEDYQFNQRPGHEFDQLFELTCVSDKPVELEIDEEA